MKNIILIGMPSSGKSTIGKTIAEKLNKTFVDMDDEIISYANMSIPDIFALKQEAGFREIETIITKKVAAKSNCVIATGGGVIKKAENMQYSSMFAPLVRRRKIHRYWEPLLPVYTIQQNGRKLVNNL